MVGSTTSGMNNYNGPVYSDGRPAQRDAYSRRGSLVVPVSPPRDPNEDPRDAIFDLLSKSMRSVDKGTIEAITGRTANALNTLMEDLSHDERFIVNRNTVTLKA